MKLKNMWKRFWTLDVHNHAGFTLVELIIVIAILAILSTGAIAGYSAYVTSANKTADKAMIAEIENVLLMAYYNGDITENGRVVLSPDSDAVATNAQIEKVLTDAYGANWAAALKLKYTEWNLISDSSFNAQGGLSGLVGTVDTLTGALAGFLEGNDIEMFAPGFDTMGATDSQGMANAAVFYVADVTGQMTSEDVTNAKNAMIQKLVVEYDPEASDGDKTQLALAALAEMNKHNGESTIGSAALMYAMATGYAEYAATELKDDGPKQLLAARTEELKDAAGDMEASSDAFISLFDTFTEMIHGDEDYYNYATSYAANALQKDADAYVDAMKTVSSSKDVILENDADISKGGYFSNGFVTDLLDSYAEGGVFVYVMSDKNGEMQIYSTIEEK